MSLHIGRLSQDVRQSYLEHLFQRFGHCTVNLKDGYGFAVYDSYDDAARAMRALQGKYVCGDRITVNWSKQQPRCSQGFRRSSRFIESSRGRNFRDAGNNIRFRESASWKNHPANHDRSHNQEGVLGKESNRSTEVVNGAEENVGDDLGEVKKIGGGTIDEDPGELKRDEGGTIDEDPGELNRDEGGKIDEDPGEVKMGEGGVDEDPGEVKTDEGVTVDVNAIEHDRWTGTVKYSPGGDVDDFDRYEPYHGYDRKEETENVIKARSYNSREHRRSSEKWQDHPDKLVNINHDKSGSPPTCYSCGVTGHIARNCPQGIDDKFKARRDGLNFREKQQLRVRRFGSPLRVQYGRKPFPERNIRVPRLSNMPRESRRDAHCSENMPATKETCKRSRSERSRGSSPSSEPSRHSHQDNVKGSHSKRISSFSRSRSPGSRSRFREHSPSYSAHSSSKSSQPTQHEGSRSNINHHVPFSVSTSPRHKSSPDVENKNVDGPMNSPLEDNLEFSIRSEVKHVDDNKQDGKGSTLNSEVPNGKALLPDKDANAAGYTGFSFGKILDVDNATNGVQSQKANFQHYSSVKSKQDVLVKNGRSRSLKLTTNEVISALKHYGMEAPKVDSSDEPVEKYFGAARLWPWEIICYRRLKKGPISTENYAKRIEQNKEYGIVDQYVRSSSGWWECH